MKIIEEIKSIEQPTAIAIGYFDGLHRGHRAVIETAMTAAKIRGLVPAVFTYRVQGKPPQGKSGGDLLTETDKRSQMAQMGVALYIAPDFETIAGWDGEAFVNEILIKSCGGAVICCGADFRFGRNRASGVKELAEMCRAARAELIVTPDVLDGGAPVSSTRIKAALAAGDIEATVRMLGHPYALKLLVQAEKKLAGHLGFPTINQRLPERLAAPRPGVYYARVLIDGNWLCAVSNLGRRPTVGGGALTLETHILNFNGQLYGREVTVELRKFLRDERRFESTDALKCAVEQDIATVRTLIQQEKNSVQL